MSTEDVLNATHGKNVEEVVSAAQCLIWRSEASTTNTDAVSSPRFISRGQSFQVLDELDTKGLENAEKTWSSALADFHNVLQEPKYCENTVFLNIYDIIERNDILYRAGLGAHHTGIEVYGTEFAFGYCSEGTGVYETEPKNSEPYLYRRQLILGETLFTREEVHSIVEELKADDAWSGMSYNLVKRNCNNFSEALARRLLPDEVRARQLGIVDIYDNGEREKLTLKDGSSVAVPLLVPRWVNRLARRASLLPGQLFD